MSVKRIILASFLLKLEELASLDLTYRSGGSGANGTCDCIGLIIGAIRRASGSWPGLHGSNYAARFEMDGLKSFSNAGELRIGELVYKARELGDSGYDLPSRYAKGGSSCTGDLRDYYHVGVVINTQPLRILHMTTPSMQTDTKIGKWRFHGWCKRIREETKGSETEMTDTVYGPSGVSGGSGSPGGSGSAGASGVVGGSTAVAESTAAIEKKASGGKEAVTIESTNGLPVKMRARPSTSCALYWEIASGASAVRTSRSGDWCKIEARDLKGLRHIGWVKNEFLVPAAAGDSASAFSADSPTSVTPTGGILSASGQGDASTIPAEGDAPGSSVEEDPGSYEFSGPVIPSANVPRFLSLLSQIGSCLDEIYELMDAVG